MVDDGLKRMMGARLQRRKAQAVHQLRQELCDVSVLRFIDASTCCPYGQDQRKHAEQVSVRWARSQRQISYTVSLSTMTATLSAQPESAHATVFCAGLILVKNAAGRGPPRVLVAQTRAT